MVNRSRRSGTHSMTASRKTTPRSKEAVRTPPTPGWSRVAAIGRGNPIAVKNAGRLSSSRIESTLTTRGQTTDAGAAISICVVVTTCLVGPGVPRSKPITTHGKKMAIGMSTRVFVGCAPAMNPPSDARSIIAGAANTTQIAPSRPTRTDPRMTRAQVTHGAKNLNRADDPTTGRTVR